ncbi:anti-sigma factor family protein [Roseovarius tibetensis]|uniref:anti-sigma factor family protein n=1 Tax=Roseovarius tibetensis TaxID=2685897 RepID=UPI003D7FD03E
MEIDDETLMALADGEITGDAAARLHARIADDPDLAARYALFTQTGKLVHAAAREGPDTVVSADLGTRIREMGAAVSREADTVVPIQRGPRWQPMALAASLALVAGLSAGAFFMSGASRTDPLVLNAELQSQLGSLPAGAQAELPDGRDLRIVASFTDKAGAFCREYETTAGGATGYVNVACRDGSDWSLRFAMATAATATGYAPAASLETLDAFYSAIDASQPLSPEAERDFLK